jgi:hypothetical protein
MLHIIIILEREVGAGEEERHDLFSGISYLP